MRYSKSGFGIPKITSGWLGIPLGIPDFVDPAGRYWIVKTLKAPYLLGFRHKKGRPWTPLDVYLVEPGGFESQTSISRPNQGFSALFKKP